MHDAEWDRVERELKRLPPPDPAAVGRVMERVRALPRHRAGARPGGVLPFERPAPRGTPLSGLAAAASVVLLLAAGAALAGRVGPTSGVLAPPAPHGVEGVASYAGDSRGGEPRPVQFVLVAAEASTVALVGDFNDWDPRATPLKASADGVWSVVVPLASGRHSYAFLVDGKSWVADAAAPRSAEDEFGTPASVVLVGDT